MLSTDGVNYFGYGPEADPIVFEAITGCDRGRAYEIAYAGSAILDFSGDSVQTLEDINDDPTGRLSDDFARELLREQWGDDFTAPALHPSKDSTAQGTLYVGVTPEELVLLGEWNIDGKWKELTSNSVAHPEGFTVDALAYTIGNQFSRYRDQAPKHRQHVYFPMGKSRTIQHARTMRVRLG